MGAQEKSLKIYDTKKTFFFRIENTFSKLLIPTKNNFNNFLLNIKRSALIKNYKNIAKSSDSKKEECEKKFEDSYALYLESIDQLFVDSIYKKVKLGTASDFEKKALSQYYNIIQLKEDDEIEYKYKKQQYLLTLDFKTLKEQNKEKNYENYKDIYILEMDRLYKALLKEYSMKLTEITSPVNKDKIYEKIFVTLDEYASNILPMKKIEDEELIKECSLFETYEVGKLDQIDILEKKMILIGISRKLFVHSLPLVVAEKCYIKLLKDTRNLIVDTKILRKRENAYQLLLRLIEQYNDKLLSVKIYWNNNEDKKEYNKFNESRKKLENVRKEQGLKEYERRKQILYIRSDLKILEQHGNKYYRIIKFYRNKLVELGDMKQLKNKCKTGEYKVVKSYRKVVENETAC
jgi:hypothetical protein